MNTSMIRTVALAAAAAALLAGCSSSSPAVHGKAFTAPLADRTAVYLRTVRPLWPASNTDKDLLRSADADCHAIEAGNDYTVVDNDLTNLYGRRAHLELAAAVKAFCPQYLPRRHHYTP